MRSLKYVLLGLLIPVQKLLQRMGRRETVMTKSIVDTIMSSAAPGDILLSYESQRWTSIFIKGFYDHAAIVSSKGTIVEAVGDKWISQNDSLINIGGVREMDLEEWLYKKDFVALVKVDHAASFIAGMNALKYIGKDYDYYFSLGEEKIYCSELPYMCWRTEWPKFLAEHDSDKEILPQQYLDYTDVLDYLELEYDSRFM